MGIISWIVLGLIAGFIGSKIVDKQGQGFWLDIALGIIGALVGGFLFSLFGATGVTGSEHLEHDCRDYRRGRGASDLQRCYRPQSRLIWNLATTFLGETLWLASRNASLVSPSGQYR